jgi:ubiquinone/menaquinone biosynthesis C-methylase UbiE
MHFAHGTKSSTFEVQWNTIGMLQTTEYFTGLAATYAQHRPSYPIEAIDCVLEGLRQPIRVVDVGCGTGISSRLLASAGRCAEVVGIDPNADMLNQARHQNVEAQLKIEYRVGTGERTGLDDYSFDLVLCAQSFHWFAPLEALREFHRVLKPHGRLALMWNVKDPTADEFSARYTAINDRAMADAAMRGLVVRSEREADPTLGGYFENVRQRTFANPQLLDLEGVLGRMASASYFPKLDPLRSQLQHERVSLMHRVEVTLADRANI